MTSLVSLDFVKKALRVDTDEDDDLLSSYIVAASAAVISYLKGRASEVLDMDSGGELVSGAVVPGNIEMATVYMVGHFYREPDSDTDKAFEQGYLPRPVTALLYPYRDPALA